MYRMACRVFLLQPIVPAGDRQALTGLMPLVISGSTEAREEMQNSSVICGDSIPQLTNGHGCMAIRFPGSMEFMVRRELVIHSIIPAFEMALPHGRIVMATSGYSVEKSLIPLVVLLVTTTIFG